MKIKVVRVAENVYNIYHGFTGFPITLPFHTKWMIDKAGITKEEASNYISRFALDFNREVILKTELKLI
jgi:hypothetical protein